MALRTERQSARAPECQKLKGRGDQYVAEPFEQERFGTVGVEWVNSQRLSSH